MKSIVCGLALAAAVLSPAVAHAQNAGLTANFGEIRLNASFTPDPYRVSITAGGSIDVILEWDGAAGAFRPAPSQGTPSQP